MTIARRFSALVVRLRYAVVVGWLALAAVAAIALPSIEEAQVGTLGDLAPSEADAILAEERSAELFGFPVLSRTSVVLGGPEGLDPEARERANDALIRLNTQPRPGLESIVGALPIARGAPPLGVAASTAAVLGYLFIDPEIGQTGQTSLARALADRLERETGAAEALVTGPVPARAARGEVIRDNLPLVQLATLLLVVAALGAYFRAVAVPLLNVAAVAISFAISVRLVAWGQEAVEVSVPREVEPVIVVLLFGIVTDYTVFLVSRFRAKLEEGRDGRTAAADTAAELLPVILTAGLIIAGASSALVIADLGFLQAFGPGLAIAVLVGALVSITFIPAALAIVGPAALWPSPRAARDPGDGSRPQRGRSRAVQLATSRPLIVAIATVAVLAVAASGLSRFEVGNPLIESLPDGNEAKRGYDRAARAFGPGITSPTVILVETPGVSDRQSALVRLQQLLRGQPGVDGVAGPGSLPPGAPTGSFISDEGDAARYFVILSSDPLGSLAVDRVSGLRSRLPALLSRAGLDEARISVGGDTALIAETVQQTGRSLAEVAPVALAVVFVLLALLLRALVAPLYLLAASLLSLLASLGLTTFVFVELLGYDGLTFFVPFAAAVLLLALGSDYNVFLVGRIWAEAHSRPLRDAVRVAGSHAAAPITTAGLVLALSFAALALIPIRSFRELAFAMSIGLLLDAFVVRTLLVPALISLIGRVSAWPGNRIGAGTAERVG